MKGTAIARELRQLAMLPLRRETGYHLVFDPHGTESPSVNRLIAVDPALALALLRLVPRSFREGRVGIAQIARMATPPVLFDLVRGSLNDRTPVPETSAALVDSIWTHSVAVAHAARQLARQRRYPHPQTAFLAGLLHNLGLFALVAVAPDKVAALFAAGSDESDWLAREKQLLGATHTNCGQQLAKRWGLPQWLVDVVWWHHQSESLPSSTADRALVELVHAADLLVARTEFGLGHVHDRSAWQMPWATKMDDVGAAVVRGVRQAVALVRDHPLQGGAADSQAEVRRMVELALRNATLEREWDWLQRASSQFAAAPPDATPNELTAIVAETFAHACGALGALCYVRSADGAAAEGSFWCDTARPIQCGLAQGKDAKPHAEQLVAQLRDAWRQRSYQQFELAAEEQELAHVLVWFDGLTPPSQHGATEAAARLCSRWLAHAAQIEQLEQQLESVTAAMRQQSADAATRLEEAKLSALAEMAAGAGHEINNPLAVISGRAQLLLAEENDPRRRKSLETIIAQAQRIHRMIVDLMVFARPPAPNRQPLGVSEAIERAVAAVRRDADDQKVELVVSSAAELPAVHGDVAQLAAALECVLRNAIEASEQGDTVRLVANSADASWIVLEVQDSGAGIPADQRQHIFEPFYSGRDAGRGLGMGLPKAWRIVKNHQGEITVASGDQGTTVTIRLPAMAAADGRACA